MKDSEENKTKHNKRNKQKKHTHTREATSQMQATSVRRKVFIPWCCHEIALLPRVS